MQIRHRLPDHIGFRRDARLGDVVLDVERLVEGGGALAALRQQAVAEGQEDDACERDADADRREVEHAEGLAQQLFPAPATR